MGAILAPQTKEPEPASASPTARDLRTLVKEQRRDDVGGKSPLPMETEGQRCQRVGGGRSFWLLCVVVVFCVVAHDLGRSRIFCARKQAFYGRTKLDIILPVVLLCYPKIPGHEKR